MKPYTLGIDTSCYTTSITVVDAKSEIIFENRKMLEVKKGARGLRQSEGFFQHVMNLPELLEEASNACDMKSIGCIAVSTRPRNVEGSYMPVFTAGERIAKSLSLALDVPMFTTTHQDGHLMAAVKSCAFDHTKPHIAVHLSGGTSEILSVDWSQDGFKCEILGGSLDISAGQLIDRVGVELGLDFPCGKELDKASENHTKSLKFPLSVKGNYFNLSGAEAYGLKYAEQGEKLEDIAAGIFEAIMKSLLKSLVSVCQQTGLKTIVMAGGVSSSTYMRSRLPGVFNAHGIEILFAKPAFAADNAIGTAVLGSLWNRGESI